MSVKFVDSVENSGERGTVRSHFSTFGMRIVNLKKWNTRKNHVTSREYLCELFFLSAKINYRVDKMRKKVNTITQVDTKLELVRDHY